MQSDSSSASDGDETGTVKPPSFLYTDRKESHIMGRESGWPTTGLNYFNTLYTLVIKDREENGIRFDDSLLKYYENQNIKKKRTVSLEERNIWKKIKMLDDLEGLIEETLGIIAIRLDDEEDGRVEEV